MGALRSVHPDRQRSYYDTPTCPDASRHAVAAAGPKDPTGLCRCGRRLGEILPVLPGPLKSRADSYLPAPPPSRAAPGVEFLQSSGCRAEILLYADPELGCPPPRSPPTDGAVAAPTGPEHRGTPAPVHECEESPAPRPLDDH